MDENTLMIRFKDQTDAIPIHDVEWYSLEDNCIKIRFKKVEENDGQAYMYIPYRNIMYFYTTLDVDPLWSVD